MSTPIRKNDVMASQWNDLCAQILARGINGNHPHASDSLNFNPDPRQPQAGMAADAIPSWVGFRESAKNVAKHFAYATYALYGIRGNQAPAYNGYAYFYVASHRHGTHFNDVHNSLNAWNPGIPATGMSLAQVRDIHLNIANMVLARLHNEVPDLRICHGSCHTNCHNSRGRR